MNLPLIAGRYRILDRIGEGGLGVVHRVEDQAEGVVRALKVLPRAQGRARLRDEFTALARLHHDNIVRVFDYGVTARGDDWFTMELVEGRPLLKAAPPPEDPACHRLIGGVLRALAFLHARGLVHADVKPSNILVDEQLLAADPARAAKLCDFGLAAAVTDPTAAAARGTFPYAAPEVYAGRLDARSDLYALGVVLYELATGKKPFDGDDIAEVIRRQRRGAPPDPRALRPSLPPGLAELVLALLEPEPGARLQTADEALARLNEFAGTSFEVTGQPPPLDLGGTLIGRERDLRQLDLLWEGARGHLGAVALVAGEEGIGKSRLLAELKLRVQLGGGKFYGASAAARPGEPYAGVARVVRAILADFGEKQAAVVAQRRGALAPLLGERAPGGAPDSRFAAAEALADLVLALSALQPMVIAFDDLQLADRATQDLFVYLARAAWTGSLLLVGSTRTDLDTRGEAARLGAALANVERLVRLDLPPLDRSSVRALLAGALGDGIADPLAPELMRVSGGNPAFLQRAVDELVAAGVIERRRGRWWLADEHPRIGVPGDALGAARTRLAALADAARRTTLAAAALGERVDFGLLAALGARLEPALDESALAQGLGAAVAARLLEAEAGDGWAFAGAGLREALAREVPEAMRALAHRVAAQVLSERIAHGAPVPMAALAEHLVALGERERALPAALTAADELAAALDHPGALVWLRHAGALRPPGDVALALRIAEREGDAHAALGEVPAAQAAYQRALELPSLAGRDALRLSRKLAELHRRVGEGDEAVALLMRALAQARRERAAEEEAACQLALARVRMYRGEYPAALEHAAAGLVIARAAGAREAVADLMKTRADVEVYRGDARAALEQCEQVLGDAAGIGDSVLADVLRTRGRAAIHVGDYPRAIESLERAIAIDRRLGRVEQEAKAVNNLGAACYFQGDWERARSSWERFRQLCERIDETSELVNALNNLGSLYRDRGELGEALAVLDRGRAVADRTGHAHMAGTILGNRGETLFKRGDLAGARECYMRCLALFEQLGAREDLIETRRRLCEVDLAEGRLEQTLERAIDAAREAQSASAKLEEGALHRVAATALRMQGDVDTATWFLERARELATTLGARYERAKVDLEEAELHAARGRTAEADSSVQRAIETFAALGARWDLARARERKRALAPPAPAAPTGPSGELSRSGLAALLDVARAAGRMDLDRLLEVVLDKILAVTRFERGFILLLDERGRPTERKRLAVEGAPGEFDKATMDFSGSIVRRVVQSGEPIAVTDVADDAALREQRSVVALGLRSVMCVPMRQKGRVSGIVYVDSRRLTDKDPTGDLALLEALAAQAGIAIENARLVAEESRKAELMAILAHEIRNPLAGILGYSELLPQEKTQLPAQAVELLERIHRDGQRLKRLVDNVLELARVEAGKVEWSVAPLRVQDLLEDARQTYQALAEKKDIELVVKCQEDLPPAFGNSDRLFQVLSNLLGNALKFTPAAGRIVMSARTEVWTPRVAGLGDSPDDLGPWLALTADDAAQTYVRVDITDSGPGIAPDKRDGLFAKFAQGAEGKKHSRGVGLGLFISREIVTRHGGQIWVESELGKGSTFSFRIPAAP
jgi:signal transduction histidine kinase/predicted ATPase